ncbi:flagellar hook-length control protein FliK [Massilia sp. W12]|uniref:flagellar hook-length control protein FliK n=1 Tax=Massilia sp. W12 TaxID=3126507 RepID=UPI0030D530EA
MLPGGDGVGLRQLAPVDPARPVTALNDAREELYQRALQRMLGQQLVGEVMSRLTDGSYMVKFGETSARMQLPAETKTGDKLPMRLVSIEPRPTFVLGSEANQQNAAAIVALSTEVQEEVENKRPTTPQSPPASAEDAPDSTQQQTALAFGAPLANNRLAQKFTQIGSMYRPEFDISRSEESASTGAIDKDGALLADMQAPPPPSRHASNASFSQAGKLINQLLMAAQREGAPSALQGKSAIVADPQNPPQQVATALADTLNKSGLFYESHVAQWVDGKRPLSDLMAEPQMQNPDKIGQQDPNRLEFAQLVNLQLHSLEQQNARWQGEIWPGQKMEWEVRKDSQQQSGGQGGAPLESWQSMVRFAFPGLGQISANIHLLGQRVHIQVQTGDEGVASLLRAHADALAEALGAAGSPLDSLSVSTHER